MFTDNQPLVHLFRMTDPPNRIFIWLSSLADFRIKVCYLSGKENVLADAFSRPPLLECRTMAENFIASLYRFLKGELNESFTMRQEMKRFFIKDNSFFRRRIGKLPQYVPITMEERKEILQAFHEGSGHLGINSTQRLIISQY